MTTVPLRDQLLEPHHARVLEKALTPGVRWKIQFGAQLVYFGRRGGLSDPTEFGKRCLSEQELTELIDGPFRSSFTTREFSDCEAVLAFLCERIPVERVKPHYILRFTEKTADNGIICYDRVGATRKEVLDDREFTTAAPFFADIRLGNFVYVLPASGREETIEDYVLVRAQVIEPKRAASLLRRVVVHKSDSNGKFSVQFVHDTAVPSYTRLQERYVLRKAGSKVEIHVMAYEESGPTVTQRGAKIRVELHCEPAQARSTDWQDFIAFAEVLAGLLEELS